MSGGADESFAEFLSDLIGRIYDCALDPARWPETLSEIRQSLNFVHATLNLQAMPSGAVLLNVASGISGDWAARIGDYSADIVALWGGLARIVAEPLETPVLLSHMNPEAVGSANVFDMEWRRPQGLADEIAVGLTRDAFSLATCSFARHESQGPIAAREIEAIRLLAPHMRRSVTISRILDARAVAAATFESVIEATGAPILIVDGQLNVLHANAAAQAMLDGRDPLHLVGQRLSTPSLAANQALAMAVEQAARDEAEIARRGLGIPVLGDDGAPRALHVLPLRGGDLRPGLVSDAVAAVFVASGAPVAADTGALVAQLFGLSATEARVFDLIAEGLTPGEAAERLGVGVATVRTHLLHIYDKTGVRRQADLVRMAASLASPAA